MKWLKGILALGTLALATTYLNKDNNIAEAEKAPVYALESRPHSDEARPNIAEGSDFRDIYRKFHLSYSLEPKTSLIPLDRTNDLINESIESKETPKNPEYVVPDWDYFLRNPIDSSIKVKPHDLPASSFEIEKVFSHTRFSRLMMEMAEEKFYKSLRSLGKKMLREQFRENPSMRFSFYEERLAQINNIGKGPFTINEGFDEEVREEIFRKSYRLGEPELSLLSVGPFTLTDSGSILFNSGKFVHFGKLENKVDVGDNNSSHLFSSDLYSVDADFKVSLNTSKLLDPKDVEGFIRRYGVTFKWKFNTRFTKRDVCSLELTLESKNPLEFKRDDFAAFFNFVVESR